jgi:hypothetical protein
MAANDRLHEAASVTTRYWEKSRRIKNLADAISRDVVQHRLGTVQLHTEIRGLITQVASSSLAPATNIGNGPLREGLFSWAQSSTGTASAAMLRDNLHARNRDVP